MELTSDEEARAKGGVSATVYGASEGLAEILLGREAVPAAMHFSRVAHIVNMVVRRRFALRYALAVPGGENHVDSECEGHDE